MRKNLKLFGIIGVFSFSLLFVSLSAHAQDSTIPDWVKNNAKWWAEGSIAESDYLSSLQYLVNQGMIQIPITKAVAADSGLTDDDRAMSFIVKFQDGEFATPETFYTFSLFENIGSHSNLPRSGLSLGLTQGSGLYLESLPSGDKKPIYDLVSLSDQRNFDVSVELISGSGDSIQTWDYSKCKLDDYTVFLQDSKDLYQFSGNEEAEIREAFLFSCTGFVLTA